MNKDFYNCKIITISSEYGEVELCADSISSMSNQDKLSLLSAVLCNLADDSAVSTLNHHGFYTKNQIKESKGIFFSNLDNIFYLDGYKNFGAVKFNKSGDVSNWGEIKDLDNIYIKATPTKDLLIQYNKYKESLAEVEKQKEAKKKERKLKKAEKLLKEAGKI